VLCPSVRLEKWMKNKNAKYAKKEQFSMFMYVIFGEQSGQAGVENGAMLTTYLSRYTLYFRMHHSVVKFS